MNPRRSRDDGRGKYVGAGAAKTGRVWLWVAAKARQSGKYPPIQPLPLGVRFGTGQGRGELENPPQAAAAAR